MNVRSGWDADPAVLLPVLIPAGLYALGRLRLVRRGVSWPIHRDIALLAGVLSLVVAIVSPLSAYDERFPVHVVQHLLLGMVAPLGFALAAPITLALRTVSHPARHLLVRTLSSRPIRWISWAPVGAVVSLGGTWLLYLTPLYGLTLRHPLLHDLVHAQMFLSGCLLTVALVGSDPVPGRGGPRTRLATLFAGLAAHDILGKYLYIQAAQLAAGANSGSVASWRLGAQWLWYGGDGIDVVLTVILCARWYAAEGRRLAHERRRSWSGRGSMVPEGDADLAEATTGSDLVVANRECDDHGSGFSSGPTSIPAGRP